MNIIEEIEKLDSKASTLNQELDRLIGQRDLLSEQLADNKQKIQDLETLKVNTTKAMELLHLVQRSTREKIKEAFEQTVTYALQSVYQKDYRFKLEFSQRGNIGELDFKIKSPENENYLSMTDCQAGGSLDIVSIALRFVLLQTLNPKPNGFVFLDEPGKMLRGKKLIQNLIDLYNEISKNFERQLIIIPAVDSTDDFLEKAENKILIGS